MTWFPSEIVDNRLHKSVSCETLTSELSTAGKTTQSIGDVFPVAFGCFNCLLLFLSLYLSDRLSSDREKRQLSTDSFCFQLFCLHRGEKSCKSCLVLLILRFCCLSFIEIVWILDFFSVLFCRKERSRAFCKHTLVVTVFFSDIYAHNYFAPLCAILLAFYKCNCRQSSCSRAELLYNVILL